MFVYAEKGEDGKELGHTVPVVEHESRINQCLYNIARGHALSMGRTQLTAEDMRLVILLAFDSAPGHRAPLFHELIRRGGTIRTPDVEELLRCSPPTALKEMKTFAILGICDVVDGETFDPSTNIRLKDDLNWFLSEECEKYLGGSTGSDSPNDALGKSDAVISDLPF